MTGGVRETHLFRAKVLQLREVALLGVEFSRRGGGNSDIRVLQSGSMLVKNKEAASGRIAFDMACDVQEES